MAESAMMKARNPVQGVAMLQRVIAALEAHLNGQATWDSEVEGVRLLICDSSMGSAKKEVVIDTWVEGPGLHRKREGTDRLGDTSPAFIIRG